MQATSNSNKLRKQGCWETGGSWHLCRCGECPCNLDQTFWVVTANRFGMGSLRVESQGKNRRPACLQECKGRGWENTGGVQRNEASWRHGSSWRIQRFCLPMSCRLKLIAGHQPLQLNNSWKYPSIMNCSKEFRTTQAHLKPLLSSLSIFSLCFQPEVSQARLREDA